MKRIYFLICFSLLSSWIQAQKLSGNIIDKTSQPLQSEEVEVKLYPTNQKTRSDKNGYFEFLKVNAGNYQLQFFHHGFKVYEKTVVVQEKDINIDVFIPTHTSTKEKTIEEVIVFGTPTQPSKRTGDVLHTGTEITRRGMEIINASGNASLNNLMNILPSVTVQNQDPYGFASNNMRVRGVRSSFSGVTTEGIPNYGGAPIGSREYIYDPENFDKIQVYKGAIPADVVSAAGNRGGAIDIKFRRPEKKWGVNLSQSYGSNSYTRTYVRMDSGEFPTGTGVFASFSYSDADKWRGLGKAGTKKHVDIGLSQKISDQLKLDAFFIYNDLFRHNYMTYSFDQMKNFEKVYEIDYNEQLTGNKVQDINYYDYNKDTQTNYLALASLQYQPNVHNKGSIRYYYNKEVALIFLGTRSGAGASAQYYLNEDRRNSARHGLIADWSGKYKNFEYSAGYWYELTPRLLGGYVIDRDVITMKLATSSARYSSVSDESSYLHNPFVKLGYSFNNFKVQAGLRYISNSAAPDNVYQIIKADPLELSTTKEEDMSLGRIVHKVWLPSLGIGYRFNANIETYLNYGRNYQRPYAYRPLFQAYQNNRAKFLALGQTYESMIRAYQFETSDNFDLGIIYNSKKLKINASAYYADLKNLLVSVVSPYYPSITASYNQMVGKAKAYGVELETYVSPNPYMTFFLHPSYNKNYFTENVQILQANKSTEFSIKGNQSPSSPIWLVKTGAMFQYKGFHLNTLVTYTGERYADALNKYLIPDNTIVDASINYHLKIKNAPKNVKIGLELKNLLNRKYISMVNASDLTQDGAATFNVGFPRTFVASMSFDF